MLLSFLWPGIGHLYVGDSGVGVPFTVISGINGILSFTIIWLVIGLPMWVGMAIYTMTDSNKKAVAHNRRIGLV